MRRERLERLRYPDPAAHAAPDARGVVEHDARGRASDELEHVAQALADAFGVLAAEQLREPHVGEREAHHQVEHGGREAVDLHVDLAEVCLGLAGLPLQVHEAVLGSMISALRFFTYMQTVV